MEYDHPITLTRRQRFLIEHSGIGMELVDLYGTTADISVLCNRAAAQYATFIYGFATMAVAGETTFGTPGEIDAVPIAIAFGLAYLLCIRMDAFVNLRGLYAQGKRQFRKMGLDLPYGADDVAWWLLLLSRVSVGIAVAIIAGTLSAQCFFRQEIQAELASRVADQNAPVLAFHTKAIDAEIKAARDNRDRDAKELGELNAQRSTLLKRETQLSGSVGRANGRQQAGISAAREANAGTLSGIETRIAAGETKAANSDQAYKKGEANRNVDLRARTESDPHFVKPPSGLLANLGALETTAAKDRIVAACIALIDFVGLAIEGWILILALASPPTKMAVNLYRDVLRHSAEAARRLAGEIKITPDRVGHSATDPDLPPSNSGPAALPVSFDSEPPPPPPRRGRGRPRKYPLPELQNGHDQKKEGATHA